ncbi:hypothetical protein O0I10_006694 [Lichtheimia ornata]|uniref:Uncharacterized protein n=1 Tax=Lichtheimia ornata TaxID=688661 RepID=A0AAD7V2W1_9FUNG|nr:uncharacterized protein O0I10_006694 [Lichtheimia ornata]KAJ8657628.1 hypothetical protein O0I10_006694 [Lichtheimia ornata]
MLLCALICAVFLAFPWLVPIALLYLAFLLVLELFLPLLVLSCLAIFYYYVWCSVAAYLKKWLAIADFSCVSQVVDANPTLITNLPVRPRLDGVAVSSRGAVPAGVCVLRVEGVADDDDVVAGGVAVSAVSGVAVSGAEGVVAAGVDVAGAEEVEPDAVSVGDEGAHVSVGGDFVPAGGDPVPVSVGDVVEDAFVARGVHILPEGDGSAFRGVRPAVGAVPFSLGGHDTDPAVVVAPDADEDADDDHEDDEDDEEGDEEDAVDDDADDAVDVDDVDDELAFLMDHLSVEDPHDEDAYMAPPFDRRYEEPVPMMEIDTDPISIMFANLTFPPFPTLIDNDDYDDPIDVDMPLVEPPSQPATPPPSPPPSPTPIPMEVDHTLLSPLLIPTTTTTNTTAVTTTINTATMPTMPTTTSATTPTTSTRHVTPMHTPPTPPHPITTTTSTTATPMTLATLAFRPRPFMNTNNARLTPAPLTPATNTINIRNTTRPPSPRPPPRGHLQQAMPQPTMRPEDAAALAELLRELGAVAEEEDEDDDQQ